MASRRCDGFWQPHLSPWDLAAGVLILRQAGGRVTDFAGKHCSIYNPEVVASNGLIHSAMVEVLREARQQTC